MKTILSNILKISEENKISKPYLVGGIPRDTYLGIETEDSDLDITTNSSDIIRLALLSCDLFKKYFKVFDDGHITIYSDVYTIDFSSNFVSDSAVKYFGDLDDEYIKEVYSRDFTINTLHMELDSSEISDPTGRGKDDIDKKIIKTVASPEVTLTDDPNRLWRAIELSARLDFDIDQGIIDFVKQNKKYFSEHPEIKLSYVENIIGKRIKTNPQKILENLIQMNILNLVPLTGEFKKELLKRRMVKDYLDML